MDTYMISEVIHKEIQVDPKLLFQRLIAVTNYANKDVDVLLSMNNVRFQPLCLSPMCYQEKQTSKYQQKQYVESLILM